MAFCRCSKHRILFPQGEKCPKCRAAFDKKRRSRPNAKFYQSKDWREKRQKIVSYYAGIDVFLFGRDGKITPALPPTVHHVQELAERPDLALDDHNLVVLGQETHALVHKMYENGHKEEALEYIRKGQAEWRKIRGDIDNGY